MSLGAQQKLLASSVVIIGLKSTGPIASLLLAGLGVGKIGLVEDSLVTLDDLHSQIIFNQEHLGESQVDSCKLSIEKHNSKTEVVRHVLKLSAHNIEEILKQYDLAIDGLVDWQDKLLVSDTSMSLNKPFIHSGINGFNFHLFTMLPAKSACLRCLLTKMGLEDFPTNILPLPISWPMVGMLGSFQALEAVKLLSGIGVAQADECIYFDGLRREFHSLRGFFPTPDCPDCTRRN